jgi:hypothetical protein
MLMKQWKKTTILLDLQKENIVHDINILNTQAYFKYLNVMNYDMHSIIFIRKIAFGTLIMWINMSKEEDNFTFNPSTQNGFGINDPDDKP